MASIGMRDGKWQARVRLKGFPKVTKAFLKRSDAQKWARGIESDMEGGRWRPEAETAHGIETLDDLLRVYHDEVTPTKRGADQEGQLIRLIRKAPECKAICSRRVDQLRASDFASLRDYWIAHGRSPATVRLRICLFSHALVTARREYGMLHVENVTKDINKPSVNNGRARVITSDEEARIVAAARHEDLSDFLTLALSTAMRRGELASLQWENIDLDKRVAVLPMTKSGRAATVALDARAVSVLRARRERAEAQGGRAEGSVFKISADTASAEFTAAVTRARGHFHDECASAGVSIDVAILTGLRFHDARHTALTRRAEQGWSVMELLALSRHASGVRLLQRYVHVSSDHLLKRFDEFERTSVVPSVVTAMLSAVGEVDDAVDSLANASRNEALSGDQCLVAPA